MIVTSDAAGRLVLPKVIRDEVDLRPGDPLDVTVRDGRIEIAPVPREVRIERRSGFQVAEPVESYDTLREPTVRRVRERLRGRRK